MGDLDVLDVFEGDEYVRERVVVHPLEPFSSLSASETSALTMAPAAELAAPVEAEAYVYSCLSDLEAELWSFDNFVKNNAWKWVGNRADRQVYAEIDRWRVSRDVSVCLSDGGSMMPNT